MIGSKLIDPTERRYEATPNISSARAACMPKRSSTGRDLAIDDSEVSRLPHDTAPDGEAETAVGSACWSLEHGRILISESLLR